uniref:Myozenin 3 n=1 Tax=Strigops habroptila TaxID=2489341 RepID=A0A672U3Y8_STRHB
MVPQPHLWLCSPLAPPEPRLDLGKKVSTAQDLMIEELSLPHNRGSRLFQQRQRRMQRFTFENLSGRREVGLRLIPWIQPGQPFSSRAAVPGGARGVSDAGGQQSYHSELHVAASPQGGPPAVPCHLSSCTGYSGPLKEVPPEKFNVTAIPKGYRSPWHDTCFFSHLYSSQSLPVACYICLFSCRRTPAPFDRTQLSDLFFVPAMELDNLSALEVIDHRRNFNRVPQGWVRVLPESDEL